MILFFYGDNDYLLARKLRELKEKYLKAAGGDLNLISLRGENFNFEEFVVQTQTMPLLATSRLIIVENIFSCPSHEILDKTKEFLPKIPDSTVVVFTQKGEPDKRLGLFKALTKPKISQNFQKLSPIQTKNFIKREVADRGGKIENDAVEALFMACPDDLWQLSNEIDKLISYAGKRAITKNDVELLVAKNITSNIFVMIDALAGGNKKTAISELENLLLSGEPPLRILAMVNYQYRLIAQVKDGDRTGLSYFQANKAASFARKFSWQDLSRIYKTMIQIDVKIKTGKIEPEEGLKELILNI
jgi:DNA polymerase-3 subunit delta